MSDILSREELANFMVRAMDAVTSTPYKTDELMDLGEDAKARYLLLTAEPVHLIALSDREMELLRRLVSEPLSCAIQGAGPDTVTHSLALALGLNDI